MNKRDTEIVKDVLSNGDFVFTDDENEADIILYNTCSVREHAEDRVIGKMGQLSKRKLAAGNRSQVTSNRIKKKSNKSHVASSKTENRRQMTDDRKNEKNKKQKAKKKKDVNLNPEPDIRYPILGIIGCMATIHKEKLFDKIPGLDLICGPSNIYNLKEDLEKVLSKNIKIADIEEKNYLKPKYKHIDKRDSQVSAWVSIMEGCENFCSYCVVPYARGKEVSRPADEIINEIKKLVDRGFKEVTLLGQNVNSFQLLENRKQSTENRKSRKENKESQISNSKLKNKDAGCIVHSAKRNDFVELLQRVNDETGIRRIRFTTNHPKDTSKELFKAMRDLDKVCPHLHLAMQSGSNKILKLMNRGYTYEKFKGLVDNLKSIYPECSLTTDIIVGFPGESDEDFMQTYQAMEEIQFDSAFIFKYSPRPKTAASKLKDDVPLKIKKERNQKLLQLQDEICLSKNKKYLNEKVEVLVEEETNKKVYLDADTNYDKKYIGRTPDNKLVFFVGDKELVGKEVEVKVLNVTTHSVIGLRGKD